MADFTYTTELTINGPWLIGRGALEELDQLLDREWASAVARRGRQVEQEVEARVKRRAAPGLDRTEQDIVELRRELERYTPLGVRSVVVHLGGTRSLRVETVGQALSELSASDECPTGFEASLRMTDLDLSITVGRPSYRENQLQIRVSPETETRTREVFGSLRQWGRNYQAPLWQQVFAGASGWFWLPSLLVLLFAIAVLPTQEGSARVAADVIADGLLRGGISQAEVPAAIELLLRIETDKLVAGPPPRTPPWFWLLLVCLVVTNLLLFIRPKTILGMGTGEQAIHRWRRWLRVVAVLVPSFIASSVVGPLVVDLVKRWLQS